MEKTLIVFMTMSMPHKGHYEKGGREICRRNLEGKDCKFVTRRDYLAIRICILKVKLYNPETVSITGMDNTSSAELHRRKPSLTTAGFQKMRP